MVAMPEEGEEDGESATSRSAEGAAHPKLEHARTRPGGGRSYLNAIERDPLTGLATRQGFNQAARALIDAHPGERFAVLYGDIDRFKVFNDRFGTEEGDRLLAFVGASIERALPAESVASHLRGDHFVCCMPERACKPDHVLALLDSWFGSYPIDFAFFVRLGVYRVDDPSLDVSLMTDRALLALRAAKEGSDRIASYDDSLRASVVQEQELAGQMADAIEAGQFELYFQPQYRYGSGCLAGAEVLARWNHPEKGIIAPGDFIPVFERTGLIADLDYHIWAETCRCLRAWLDAAGPDGACRVPRLSVNLSRKDIYREDLCDYLAGLVKENGIPHHLLHLEIAESSYMENPEQLADAVAQLQKAGFVVEMDDFGSGYSSLNALKDVPVDVLKLDLRFLDARNDTRGGVILASVVRMARWLDLPVIAEGVESKSQAQFLSSIGCDMMQGFLFSKPVDRASFEKIVEEAGQGDFAAEGARRRSAAASELWDAESLAAFVFSNYAGPAALVEREGGRLEVVRSNDAFLDVLGLPTDVYIRTPEDLFGSLSASDRESFDEALARAEGEAGSGECELLACREGREFWIRVNFRRLSRLDAASLLMLLDEITEDKKRDLRFKQQAEQQRQLYETIPCGIIRFVAEPVPAIVSANRAAWHIFGCASCEEFRAYTAEDVFRPLGEKGRAAMRDAVERLAEGSDPITFSSPVRRLDGTDGWVEGVLALATTSDGPLMVQCAFNDVTDVVRERHERAWQSERYRILSELTHAISFDYDSESDTVQLYIDRTGKGMELQVIPSYLEALDTARRSEIHPEDVDAVKSMFERVRAGSTNEIIEYRADYYGTGFQWYRANLFVAGDECGSWHLVGLIDSIQDEHDLRLKAEHDAITGLSNYASTRDLVNDALADSRTRAHSVFAVVDLDDFKAVNDTCGHLRGDELLRDVAGILRSNCRETDIVGRVGGDEFVVLLKHIGLEVALGTFAAMRSAVAAMWPGPGDLPVAASISIGVTETVEGDEDYRSAFSRADKALYEAKRAGKNQVRVI